jgi:hypothetical protein
MKVCDLLEKLFTYYSLFINIRAYLMFKIHKFDLIFFVTVYFVFIIFIFFLLFCVELRDVKSESQLRFIYCGKIVNDNQTVEGIYFFSIFFFFFVNSIFSVCRVEASVKRQKPSDPSYRC